MKPAPRNKDSLPVTTVTGIYRVQRSGDGIVTPKWEKAHKRAPFQKIFILPSKAGEAWHGDMVKVGNIVFRGRGKCPMGRIVHVIERRHTTLVVRVQKMQQKGTSPAVVLATPTDTRFSFKVHIDAHTLPHTPQENELILVRIDDQVQKKTWACIALASYGFEDDVQVQERLVKLNHLAPAEFPPDVLKEAATLPTVPSEADKAGREDMRHLPFVTIDGEDARDFDDAIHVEKCDTGWLLRVAIADVTHYVQPQSPLDKEAQERANSWYFPTSVEPMLPPALSHGLCSLNPHVDRLIMLAEIHIDAHGQPQQSRFAAGVICSAARLTYTQVALLEKEPAAREALYAMPRGAEIVAVLEEATRLAHVLAAHRVQRGSLDFAIPDTEYIFSAQGSIESIRRKQSTFAHQLIEECMIVANEAVARFLEAKNLPCLYRVHPESDPTRIVGLLRTLASAGLTTPTTPAATHRAKAVQNILHTAKGSPQEFLVGRLTLRTMSQARYQPTNEGHFGLASACYCHFTSPIRRYADVVVHRALKYALGLDDTPIPTGVKLQSVGDQCNAQERAAIEAEREIARRLATVLLRHHVGEIFTGTVTGVSDVGIFVELDAMPVEGMIRLDSLWNEYYKCDHDKQELLGTFSGLRFYLGLRVQTRLVNVNEDRLEITLALTEMPASANGLRVPPAAQPKKGTSPAQKRRRTKEQSTTTAPRASHGKRKRRKKS